MGLLSLFFQMSARNTHPKLIPLASDEGQRLLREVKTHRWPHQPLLGTVFCKQSRGGACGIQSCGLLLNAAYLGRTTSLHSQSFGNVNKYELPYTESKISAHIATRQAMDRTGLTVLNRGISLEQVADILACHGCEVKCHFAAKGSHKDFVHIAKEALSTTNSSAGIIINYHRGVLGQQPYSHHSPLGAYHEGNDLFLIYDTGGEDECWVPSSALYDAMNTVDRTCGKSRGFVTMKLASRES